MVLLDIALDLPEPREQLGAALISAFPNQGDLTDLATGILSRSAPKPDEPETMARGLVDTYRANSSVRLLLRAARELNPGNEQLLAFEAAHCHRSFDAGFGNRESAVHCLDRLVDAVMSLFPKPATVLEHLEERFDAATNNPPPAWVDDRASHRARVAALLSLVAEQDGSGLQPIFRLLEPLAVVKGAKAEELALWVDKLATKLPRHVAAARQLLQRHPLAEGRCYLMIRIKPNAMGDGYSVKAWAFSGDEPKPVWEGGDYPSLNDVKSALSQQLDTRNTPLERALRGIRPEQVTYEFILTRDELHADVDAWPIGVGQLPLGRVHPVVVRSYERIYTLPDRGWAAKWDAWLAATASKSCCIHWHDSDSARTEDYRLKLVLSVVALAFDSDPATLDHDALMTSVSIGVPIAIWPRRACQETKDVIKELIDSLPAHHDDYRDGLLKLRQLAPPAAQHLTLLWDDPSHLPPDRAELHDIPLGE
jgi:hypothetical protein